MKDPVRNDDCYSTWVRDEFLVHRVSGCMCFFFLALLFNLWQWYFYSIRTKKIQKVAAVCFERRWVKKKEKNKQQFPLWGKMKIFQNNTRSNNKVQFFVKIERWRGKKHTKFNECYLKVFPSVISLTKYMTWRSCRGVN